MAFNFPSNPTINQVYEQYYWNGSAWVLTGDQTNEPINCDVVDGGDFDTAIAIEPSCLPGTSTRVVTTATYQMQVNDFYVGVNYDGNATITMPVDVNNGLRYIVKDERGEAASPSHYITIVPSASHTIDGEASIVIGFAYGSLSLIWRSNAWRIV